MSGVSVVSGALANGDGPVVVSTDKPVFSDDSGVRATVLKWGVWAICLSAVLLGTALVVTLRTHVPLPGMDRLLPPRGQLEGQAVLPTQESSRQPLRPSAKFRSSPTPTSQSARKTRTPISTSARPRPTVKRAAPRAAATSAARTSTPATQAKPSDQATTKARNPNAATPSPPRSRPTSKPGHGPG
jgi:cytoskeletal protein RodZ